MADSLTFFRQRAAAWNIDALPAEFRVQAKIGRYNRFSNGWMTNDSNIATSRTPESSVRYAISLN
ncbi:hypothetical protein F4W66_24990 (plasmid) [Escherichia coli]|nr:hypothetical protein F4W66_24990 [Escherichia coli]